MLTEDPDVDDVALEAASASAENNESVDVVDVSEIPNSASVACSCIACSEIWTMSLAGAFSSAFSIVGEDSVDASGEFSLVRVWSRSERPLFVEATDPINAFVLLIGIGKSML